jgi:hypothetical protein
LCAAGGRDLVIGVITFLLNYLQLYILVIQSLVENGRIVSIGQGEAMLIEEVCDLSGT